MADKFMHTVLTPAVLEAELKYYGRQRPVKDQVEDADILTEREIEMIQSRDSFYISTITENGWPYIQHRGGPAGFLKTLEGNRIAFADYSGNRQMISVGSISKQDRVAIFMMDYPSQTRLKMLGKATVLDAREHPDLIEQTAPPSGHAGKVERIFNIEIIGYDWNCPQFITRRFTAEQVEQAVQPLRDRIAELEKQIDKNS